MDQKKNSNIEVEKDSALVSIIIPTFNRAELITQTLNSFKNQNYKNWECIIIDDGSGDNTANIVKKFSKKDSRFKYFERPKSLIKGPGSCRNYGLRKALGAFIQFFDDDDLAHKNMLSEKVKILLKHDADVVVSKLRVIQADSQKVININEINSSNIQCAYFKHKIAWYICGPMWRKSFLSETFDPKIELLDDWEFNLRCILKQPKIYFINIALSDYIKRNSSFSLSSTNNIRQLNSEYKATKKIFNLFKKQGFVTKSLRFNYLNQIINVFRKIDQKEPAFRLLILKEILHNLTFKEPLIFFRLSLGYLSYYLFNKGYRLIYIKNLR
jgi:glycosyltransferase involved in cell wall biosynthesis